MTTQRLERLVFLLLMAGAFAWIAWEAHGFPRLARIFPYTIAVAALTLCLAEVARVLYSWWRGKAPPDAADSPGLVKQLPAALPYLLWIGGYYLAIAMFGFIIASALFVFAFVTIVGKLRWPYAMVGTALLLAGMLLMGDVMNLYWPQGLLGQVLGWRWL